MNYEYIYGTISNNLRAYYTRTHDRDVWIFYSKFSNFGGMGNVKNMIDHLDREWHKPLMLLYYNDVKNAIPYMWRML